VHLVILVTIHQETLVDGTQVDDGKAVHRSIMANNEQAEKCSDQSALGLLLGKLRRGDQQAGGNEGTKDGLPPEVIRALSVTYT
jgi:hypothetical protein